MNGDDFFDRWHEDGDVAFAILQDNCETPPSLEVFEHGLEAVRKRTQSPITIKHYARMFVDEHMRIQGL